MGNILYDQESFKSLIFRGSEAVEQKRKAKE